MDGLPSRVYILFGQSCERPALKVCVIIPKYQGVASLDHAYRCEERRSTYTRGNKGQRGSSSTCKWHFGIALEGI